MDYLKSFGITTPEGNHSQEAFYSLILIYNLLFQRMNQYLQEWGLTPAQFNILMVVNKQGKDSGISQVELSNKLIVTPSNTTRLLEKMENEKLILRVSQEQDKRVKLVFITPKGSAVLEKIWPGYLEEIQQAVAPLSDQDQKLAANILHKWLDRLVE